jgi:hypothetical protein
LKKFFIFLFIITLISSCKKINKMSDSKISDSISIYIKNFNKNLPENKNTLDKAYLLIKLLENDSISRAQTSDLAFQYYNINDLNKFKLLSYRLQQNSKMANDSLQLAKSYRFLGGYYKNIQVFDSSFYYYVKAEKIYQTLKIDIIK